MPRRAKITQLPREVRDELDRRLIANAFSQYQELTVWLRAQGYPIGKTAVHKYGSALDRARSIANVKPVPAIVDVAISSRASKAEAVVRSATGVVVLVVDPATHRVWPYVSRRSVADTLRGVEGAVMATDAKSAVAAADDTDAQSPGRVSGGQAQ